MKKIVKFSGTEKDVVLYATIILIPRNQEKLEECADLIFSSGLLGECVDKNPRNLEYEFTDNFCRMAKINILRNKILLTIRYYSVLGNNPAPYQLKEIKTDVDYIAEHIETMITALEEE